MGALKVRVLEGLQAYLPVWHKMQAFTANRTPETPDEIWILQHESVFTLGRNGRMEHVLASGDIPVIPIDRGGQVTYHGPGQLIVYLLLDLRRKSLGIRQVVETIEQAIIAFLAEHQVLALGDRKAPGVYVDGKKIAALGLRVSKSCTYHGLSLNVAMDTEPFTRINPCGYAGLQVTQCQELGIRLSVMEVASEVATQLARQLDYNLLEWMPDPP